MSIQISNVRLRLRSGWTDKAVTLLNRGFPRIHLLSLLKDRPMNAREIIDELINSGGGPSNASPTIVYPLLAKLVEEDLLYQTEEGRYTLTKKGMRVVNDIGSVYRTIRKQIYLLSRFSAKSRKALLGKMQK